MIIRDYEVISEHLNGLVEIDFSGVPAHRLRARLATVGGDAVAVLAEVAE
jgi:hypothetical protein